MVDPPQPSPHRRAAVVLSSRAGGNHHAPKFRNTLDNVIVKVLWSQNDIRSVGEARGAAR